MSRSRPAYFTTPISENIEETPEGFLIARDCVLGRTGWQTYKVGDLPQDAAKELGVDISNPSATIELYRDANEVFHPDTLASTEAKPVTDDHPNSSDGFVHPDNFAQFARGHVQNVHKGSLPLDTGDWPILGDVHVTAEPLISEVRNKRKRELSLGYDYAIRRIGDRIEQCNILVNHIAVVSRGRAGPEARIHDSAETLIDKIISDPIMVPSLEISPPAESHIAAVSSTSTTTERKMPMKSNFLRLIGLGLKARAADADPEELAQEAIDMAKHHEEHVEDRTHAADKKADDKKGEDRHSKLHDALDCMLDGKKAKDADLKSLRKLMDEFLEEEEEEPEHAEDSVNTEELKKTLSSDSEKEEEKEEEEEEHAEDSEKEEEEEKKEHAADRGRAADGALAALKSLRPVIARTKDEAVKKAFNQVLSVTTRSSKASEGSYGKFAATSRARDKAPKSPVTRGRAADQQDDLVRLSEFAKNAHRGGKGNK